MPLLFFLVFSLLFPFVGHTVSQEEVLLQIAKRARESRSDAILILRNGKTIFEYRSEPLWQPIDTLFITESIVGVIIGILIDEGKIASLDTPVFTFYPEWNQGKKRSITLRHLLTHTSGLYSEIFTEIYQAPDAVQLALCAEMETVPGSCFCYNQKAVALLSGIVEKASGLALSEYADQKLFQPLEIKKFSWQCDAAHHDYVFSHLALTAPDLAKIGELVANRGIWRGKRVVSENWIDQLTEQGQAYNPFSAHLWWVDYYSVQCYWDEPLLAQYQKAGISNNYVKALRALQGRVIVLDDRLKPPCFDPGFSQKLIDCFGGRKNFDNFFDQISDKQLPITRWMVSGAKNFAAIGLNGQQLFVFPSKNVIAVRQARSRFSDPFLDFATLVDQLIYCQET